MLTSVVLTLDPQKREVLPIWHGSFAHAAALDLFLRNNAKLARAMHADDERRPFTVGNLQMQKEFATERGFEVSPGQLLTWRITGLTEEVSTLLQSIRAGTGVRIGAAIFEITQVATSCEEHREANCERYSEIVNRWQECLPENLPKTFECHFVSPTAFRRGRAVIPLPIPEVFWPGLLEGWNWWATAACPQLNVAMAEDIVLADWKGETRQIEVGSRRTVGFIGRVRFQNLQGAQDARRLMAMLAEFSFFAGVGWQTTRGMGQVRWSYRRFGTHR